MGWLTKIATPSRRDSFSEPSEDLFSAMGGERTYSGKRVTPANAIALIPVWRAINLRASAIGSMPLEVFRNITNPDSTPGRTLASDSSRPWQLLHDKANDNMTAVELFKIVESHLAAWGNAFIWKERGSDGRIANLWPLSPRRVQVGRDANGSPVFLVQTYAATPPGSSYINYGEEVICDDTDILHIRALSDDGLVGFSPIQVARQAIGGMMAQQEYEGRYWANDGSPGTVLVHPNRMKPDALERIRAIWDRGHRGPYNARRTAVLGENISVKEMSVPMADAQFVQIAGLRRTDIALLFGLPPYMLAGASGSSMTYSNTETQSTDLVKWSLRDSMTTIESAVTWDPDIMPLSWFAKFQAGEILRGSQTERFSSYAQAPHLLVDEVRELENRAPLPDGKGQIFAKEVGPQVIAAAVKADAGLAGGIDPDDPTKQKPQQISPITDDTDAVVGPSLDGGH